MSVISFPQGPVTDERGRLSLEWFMFFQNLGKELSIISTMTAQAGLSQFIPAAPGEDGEDGHPGPPGPSGVDGARGVDGQSIRGLDGDDGFDGFQQVPNRYALTRGNDTNVTLTLGGDPNFALVAPITVTAGWTGQLAVSRGGTNVSTIPATRVLYTAALDTVSTSANLTFDGTTVTANNLSVTGTTVANQTLLGNAAAIDFGPSISNQFLQVNAVANASAIAIGRWSANATGPRMFFGKSRSGSIGTFSGVSSGDILGEMRFVGDNSTALSSEGARISVIVDGTPSAGADMPGSFDFGTAADGTATIVSRVKIGNQGNVILNNSGTALTTTATGGFTYLPTCSGTPTGTPAVLVTGAAPVVIDSANNKLYFYSGAAWRDAGP